MKSKAGKRFVSIVMTGFLSIFFLLADVNPIYAEETLEGIDGEYNEILNSSGDNIDALFRDMSKKISVSLDGSNSAAIKSDGSLWTWGANGSEGDLGDGSNDDKLVPVKIMDNVMAIDMDNRSAIKYDGSLWSWGKEYGSTPVKILDNVKSFGLGGRFMYSGAVIDNDDSLWTWGYNMSGEMGNGAKGNSWDHFYSPEKIMENVKSVYTDINGQYCAAIKSDGSLWMWGANGQGQLGDGSVDERLTPVKVMENVKSVSLGNLSCAAIKNDGTLWTWGSNDFGQLGIGSEGGYRTSPVKIMDDVSSVSMGASCGLAIKNDGSLWLWGGVTGAKLKPSPEKVMENVKSIVYGIHNPAVIKNDDTLWIWGWNYDGQVGDGTTTDRQSPVKIMEDVKYAYQGFMHCAAIKNDGSLWTWGSNDSGEIGDGTTVKKLKPVKIMELLVSTPTEYTVSFDSNGGSSVPSQTVEVGELASRPSDPVRTGYVFAGWYRDSDLTQAWDFWSDAIYSNMTLYAKWEEIKCLVTFDSDGGSSVSSQTVKSGGTVKKPSNPVKTGYTFAGWYKDALLTNAWNFSTDVVTADMTLYAKWELGDNTVKFNSNGGSAVSSQTVKTGNKATKPSNPTRSGYTFAGWYKNSSLTTPWDFDNDVVSSNITLYAKWVKNSSSETKELTILTGQHPVLSNASFFGKTYDRYLVSDTEVASVSGNTLNAKKAGTVTVYGLIESGDDYVIDTDNKGITFTIKSVWATGGKVKIKKKKKLDVSQYFSAGGLTPEYFYSSKPKVAKVTGYSTVVGKKKGKAKIWARYTTVAGSVDYYVTVQVK